MNWKIFGKIMKTFQGNIEFLNDLIYEIWQKFWKNFDNVKLNFLRILKGLQKRDMKKFEKFVLFIFKKKY